MCTHQLPAHRKLLPRPCPQCGQENGGCQLVIFNPKFYEERTGYARRYPYSILRISHYSKEQYALQSKTKNENRQGKIWHNFQIRLSGLTRGSDFIRLEEIFNDFFYADKQSITLPLGDDFYNYVKNNGWTGWTRIVIERAHWIKKRKNKDLKVAKMESRKLLTHEIQT